MKSHVARSFRKRLAALPMSAQEPAARAYALRQADPYHPGLELKAVSQRQPIYSVRVGLHYRALALLEEDRLNWFLVGPHGEYDELLRRP